MNLDVPFTTESLNQLRGQTLVVSKNIPGDFKYQKVAEKKMLAPGVIRGGRVEINEGRLEIYDGDGLWCHFNAVEWNGATRYVRGTFDREMNKATKSSLNATLHIKKPYGAEPFGVCISTCQKYAEDTMPVVLKSLVNARISAERIVAVVGGHGINSEEVIGNIRTLTRIQSENSYNGLMGVNDKYKYWLLLEDTSAVEPDLVDRIRELDIGLNPDVVLAAMDSSMGLYSTDFINRVKGNFETMGVANAVSNGLCTSFVYEGEEKTFAPRDIYGKGVRRATRNLPIGIQKYDSRTLKRIRS